MLRELRGKSVGSQNSSLCGCGKHVIEQGGGPPTVESAIGQRTTFEVRLP